MCRTFALLVVGALAAHAGGCAVIQPPPDMTVAEATDIIRSYMEKAVGEESAGYINGEYVWPFRPTADEHSFQYASSAGRVELDVSETSPGKIIRVPLFKVREIPYAAIGTFRNEYSAANILSLISFLFFGPTLTGVGYAPRLHDGRAGPTPDFARERNAVLQKHILLNMAPLWLFGTPFLIDTREEEFFQALSLLRDHNR